jgi:glutathione synthase/RimK-type ligase-like ATP-grasp enzyme
VSGAPGEASGLAALARAAARALGLEVYGGDCVIDTGGALWLIDVNDWPSFAPCRAAGAEAIARRLEAVVQPTRP